MAGPPNRKLVVQDVGRLNSESQRLGIPRLVHYTENVERAQHRRISQINLFDHHRQDL
jgi:hypothetical protein